MTNSAQTLTRSDLTEKLCVTLGLSRNQSNNLLEVALEEMASSLENRGIVKISSFGTFHVRQKNERIGRNPKTGKEVMITSRKSLSFRASHILKDTVDRGNCKR